MQISLREWNFDTRFSQILLDCKIQIAAEAARSMAHFIAPDD
jgi:hypothetical protein